MDRDPQENMIDPEDEGTPSSGQSDFGESGAQRARDGEKRDDGGAHDRGERDKRTQPPIQPPPD